MPDRRDHVHLLAVIGVVLLLFLPAGGLRDWWYPDEPDVALPAIEMQARGDWVVPTHNGKPWLDYPPLAYWGARAVGSVTGSITPWGTRVSMALFAAVLLIATLWLGRQLGQVHRGLLACAILLATPTLWFHATNLQVDLGFSAAIAMGLACYYRSDALTGAAAWWLRVAAFACFGVAILGKGPLGVLLPGLILTCWHLWNREWMRVLLLAPLALVSLAVALPWYLMLCERLGADFVLRELFLQNFDRFGESKRGHGNKGFFYYFTRLPVDLGLWTVLILPALWSGFRHRRDERSWRLLAVWLIAPLIFFTFASTKRNVYLLPVFPALALLIADWLAREGAGWEVRWRAWSSHLLAGVLVLVGLVLVAAGLAWTWLPQPTPLPAEAWFAFRPAALVIGVWLMVAGIWTLRTAAGNTLRPWWELAGTTTLGFVLVMWLVLPVIDTLRSYRPAAEWLVARVPVGGSVGFHVPGRENTKRPAWLCYLAGRRLEFFTSPDEASAWLAADHARLLLTSPARVASLSQVDTLQEWLISSDEWVVVGAKR